MISIGQNINYEHGELPCHSNAKFIQVDADPKAFYDLLKEARHIKERVSSDYLVAKCTSNGTSNGTS